MVFFVFVFVFFEKTVSTFKKKFKTTVLNTFNAWLVISLQKKKKNKQKKTCWPRIDYLNYK